MRRVILIDAVGEYQFVKENDADKLGQERHGPIHTLTGDQRDTSASLGDEGELRWSRLKGGKGLGEWRFRKVA